MLDLIRRTLVREGFEVDVATDGETAWKSIRQAPPDLVILDWMMPRMSGLDVCRAARAWTATATLPLIMLSARTEEVDRIVAFELGVDDFVTKPFSPRELTLRVKAILRGTKSLETGDKPLSLGLITLDESARTVLIQGGKIPVTPVEFRLLRYLLLAPNRVHSREELLEHVWEGDQVELRTIDTQIRRLRVRLGAASDQIETVRAFGYRLSAGAGERWVAAAKVSPASAVGP